MQNKEAILNNTLVFETLGEPQKAREFKLKHLKKWGFDLIFGKKNNKECYFSFANKKEGDTFSHEENDYEVVSILKELPKNTKLLAHIAMIEGKAYLIVNLLKDETEEEILKIEAAKVLLAFLKKHKLPKIIESIKSIGSATNLVKGESKEGIPKSFEELPPLPRRFLREAKKIEKEMGFGRVTLQYFGENKDKKARFYLEWLIPTIALFDETIAQKIDKTLAEFA